MSYKLVVVAMTRVDEVPPVVAGTAAVVAAAGAAVVAAGVVVEDVVHPAKRAVTNRTARRPAANPRETDLLIIIPGYLSEG